MGRSAWLLPEAQAGDQLPVAGHVLVIEISEESASLADHFEEAAAAGVIVPVDAEVLAKFPYPPSDYGDLDFYGSCVVVTAAILFNY